MSGPIDSAGAAPRKPKKPKKRDRQPADTARQVASEQPPTAPASTTPGTGETGLSAPSATQDGAGLTALEQSGVVQPEVGHPDSPSPGETATTPVEVRHSSGSRASPEARVSTDVEPSRAEPVEVSPTEAATPTPLPVETLPAPMAEAGTRAGSGVIGLTHGGAPPTLEISEASVTPLASEGAESAEQVVAGPVPVGGPPLVPLLEDGPLLAFQKPAGLLTVGAIPHVPTLERQVKEHLRSQYLKPGNVYLGIPHRLDRPVSGVVVFARNSKCAARLAEMFRERRVRKLYLAVVEGDPPGPEGELVDWLLKDEDAAHVRVVPPHTPGAREARLRYRVLARAKAEGHPGEPGSPRGRLTGLEIELDTGRMHQIRVQLASRGWPVLGDRQYGAKNRLEPLPAPVPSDPAELANLERDAPIALHACRLMLKHPVRYDDLIIDAPVPENWQGLPIPPEAERGAPGTVLLPRKESLAPGRGDDD